jgi:hypothetical protein
MQDTKEWRLRQLEQVHLVHRPWNHVMSNIDVLLGKPGSSLCQKDPGAAMVVPVFRHAWSYTYPLGCLSCRMKSAMRNWGEGTTSDASKLQQMKS